MPTPVIVPAVLAASVVAATTIDLTRHDARALPKWAWRLIILVAFPFGVIACLVMGRSRPGRAAERRPRGRVAGRDVRLHERREP